MTQNNTSKRGNTQCRDEMKIIEVMSRYTDLVCYSIMIWAHFSTPVLKGILFSYVLMDSSLVVLMNSTESQFRYHFKKILSQLKCHNAV